MKSGWILKLGYKISVQNRPWADILWENCMNYGFFGVANGCRFPVPVARWRCMIDDWVVPGRVVNGGVGWWRVGFTGSV